MNPGILEVVILSLNILICVIILWFIKKQRLRRYVLFKNSFYGFYIVMILFFLTHVISGYSTEAIGRTMGKLEGTSGILAALIFGNVVVTLRYPKITSTTELLKEYFSNLPYPHFIYSIIMLVGIVLTWVTDSFVEVFSSTPGFKTLYVVFIALLVLSAVTFPTFYMLKHILRQKRAGLTEAYLERFKIMTYSYLLLVVLISGAHGLAWYTKRSEIEFLGYAITILPMVLMAYALKEPEVLEKLTFKKPEIEKKPSVAEFQRVLGRSALIEYIPSDNYEDATITAVVNYLSSGKNVVLISQAPRAGMYYEKLEYFIEKEVVKVVDITTESPLARPQMFRVASGGGEAMHADEKKGLINVSINNLEYLTEITDQMPEGSVLIFEALTGIILSFGSERKEAIYKFFSGIVEGMSAKDRTLVVFLNRGAHEMETVRAYEGLFITILKIEGEGLVTIKGEKKKMSFVSLEKQ
jgi:hypothetical protein